MGEDSAILDALEWYHGTANRHISESLLMQNATDGTFLMRPGSKFPDLAVSVRCKDSVKHYSIQRDGPGYRFGMGSFSSLKHLIKHIERQPVVGGDAGSLAVLKYPYPKTVDELQLYESIVVHAECGRTPSNFATNSHQPVLQTGTKEGFLTKQGNLFKSWKTRWFVLQKNELRYSKHKDSDQPIRTLNLNQCIECSHDNSTGKENCFKLVFPSRTFYIYASTDTDLAEWMALIQHKMKHRLSSQCSSGSDGLARNSTAGISV